MKSGRPAQRLVCGARAPPAAATFVLAAISLLHWAGTAAFDVRPAQRVLERVLPQHAAQFELRSAEPKDGREYFRVAAHDGRVRVEASTSSALLFGVNWYLKYVAHLHVSSNGDQLGAAAWLPLPDAPIEIDTPYAFRYALNEN